MNVRVVILLLSKSSLTMHGSSFNDNTGLLKLNNTMNTCLIRVNIMSIFVIEYLCECLRPQINQ